MTSCPTCGRRHRPRRIAATSAPLPLFEWTALPPRQARPSGPPVRMLLLHGCPDAMGDPRPALLIPGRRLPVAFPTLAAALAAKRSMEAAR